MRSITFGYPGDDPLVQITITENALDGTLIFDIQSVDGADIDIRGLFFGLTDPALADSLAITGDDVSASSFGDVTRAGPGNALKGPNRDAFDVGVGFGQPGRGKGRDKDADTALDQTSFTLGSTDGTPLTLDLLAGSALQLNVHPYGQIAPAQTGAQAPFAMPAAPDARDDVVSTNEDTPVVINVLQNDTDADGDALTITDTTSAANGIVTIVDNKLLYTADEDFFGMDSFTYTVTDGNGGVDTAVVDVTINPVNDAPGFTAGADVNVLEDAGAQTILGWANGISAGPANEASQTVTFKVSTDNDSLFAALPAVASDGTLTFTPAANAFGSATVSVTAMDDGGTANGGVDTSATQTFTIKVDPVNDAPGFTAGADVNVQEDAGAQTIPGWATGISADPANEAGQTVTFNVSTDNDALFAVGPAVAADGTLTFTPAANAFGSATVSVTAMDDGGTANGGVDASATQTFTINVTPVNDAPSFTLGTDQTVLEDAGLQEVLGYASAISPGPANEAGQSVDFLVTNNTQPGLFAVAPTISATGALSYRFADNAFGTAEVTVVAMDDGGTANGGVDSSAAQTFSLTALSVNDVPVVSSTQFTISETAPAGLGFPALAASDVENDPIGNWMIVGGNADFDGDGTDAFAIDPVSGVISIADSDDLDFELRPCFTLQVTASDPHDTSAPADVTIFVDNVFDFDGSLPGGIDANGNLVGFNTYQDPSSSIVISTTGSPPAALPDAPTGADVIQFDYQTDGFAGFNNTFANPAVDTWISQDWSCFSGVGFWFYGNNTGGTFLFDILDNRNAGSTVDDADRYTVAFNDDFTGWQYQSFDFVEFVRKETGNGAPNDGLTLTEVWGYGVSAIRPLGTTDPVGGTVYVDPEIDLFI